MARVVGLANTSGCSPPAVRRAAGHPRHRTGQPVRRADAPAPPGGGKPTRLSALCRTPRSGTGLSTKSDERKRVPIFSQKGKAFERDRDYIPDRVTKEPG